MILCRVSLSQLLGVMQEAEERLLATLLDGRFLVRRHALEDDTYVISLVLGSTVYHNKVFYALTTKSVFGSAILWASGISLSLLSSATSLY